MLTRRTLTSTKFARRRRKLLIWRSVVVVVLAVGLFVGSIYLARWQAITVKMVTVEGNAITPTADIQTLAETFLSRTYLHLYPARNIFLYPRAALAQAILAKWLRISSVEIRRVGFDGLDIKVVEKDPAYLWCGADEAAFSTSTTSAALAGCSLADADGFIFAPVEASTTPSSVTLRLYGALSTSTAAAASSASPLGERYAAAGGEFAYMKSVIGSLSSLGFSVERIYRLSDDEADFLLSDGTRLLMSDRIAAASALQALARFLGSATTTNAYSSIDLRYKGKIYYKAAGK